MALHEHLDHAGGGAEVAVDLERTAEVEEIGQGALGEQQAELSVGHLGVAHAGPERHAPGEAPAGGAVAAPLQQESGGVVDFGVGGRDVGARVEGPERGHVAVGVIGHIHVLEPLLELAVFSDLIGRELGQQALELGGQVRVPV